MEKDEVDRSRVGEGHYVNYAEIGHNNWEFVFDFGQVWLDGSPAGVYVRIVTSPETAVRMHQLLTDALGRHRSKFGKVQPDDSQSIDERCQ